MLYIMRNRVIGLLQTMSHALNPMPMPKPLGRWSIDKNRSGVSVTNYYSNIDHCGSCDYQKEIIDDIIRREKEIKNDD